MFREMQDQNCEEYKKPYGKLVKRRTSYLYDIPLDGFVNILSLRPLILAILAPWQFLARDRKERPSVNLLYV